MSSFNNELPKDHFIEKDGVTYAGNHLIIDAWDASYLDDQSVIDSLLKEIADVCGATLLHVHTHMFFL